MKTYYEVELAKNRDYDYTLGDTVSIAVISDKYPNSTEIEEYLKKTNSRFCHLKVCYIVELLEMDMPMVIPYVEETIEL